MKTVGIIGGIGPEATVEYYRLIIASYRELELNRTGASGVNEDAQKIQDAAKKRGDYPSIIINSINLKKLLDLMIANELPLATEYLVAEVNKLGLAGADFGVLASNTPHIVFDELRARSPIPLLSIVEATCERAQALGLKTVGLIGTRFTMQARFYPDVFSRAGITLVVPDETQQMYIHDKYLGELLNNIFLPETRQRMLAIADELKARHGIEGLILGGTELPLLLRDAEHNGIAFLDTTRIHVKRIVAELLT